MQQISRARLIRCLSQAKQVVLISHANPDGDALGSSLGLYHWIKEYGFTNTSCSVIVPNAYPEFLSGLPSCSKVLIAQHNPELASRKIDAADVIILLDFNALKRIDALGAHVAKSKAIKVLIDHHQQPEPCADYYFHDVKACSTSELVFELTMPTVQTQKYLTKAMATCIYTGIMTDTGNFRFPSVRSKTHTIVSHLLRAGIAHYRIHEMVYDAYTLERMQLLGFGLTQKLECLKNIPVAFFSFSYQELQAYKYAKGDLEGVVNYGLSIKGIQICALFNEQKDGTVRISFRSKGKADVNRFARRYFNGGGHINAAGGRSMHSLSKTLDLFKTHIKELF